MISEYEEQMHCAALSSLSTLKPEDHNLDIGRFATLRGVMEDSVPLKLCQKILEMTKVAREYNDWISISKLVLRLNCIAGDLIVVNIKEYGYWLRGVSFTMNEICKIRLSSL
jgi:hypothetical protein